MGKLHRNYIQPAANAVKAEQAWEQLFTTAQQIYNLLATPFHELASTWEARGNAQCTIIDLLVTYSIDCSPHLFPRNTPRYNHYNHARSVLRDKIEKRIFSGQFRADNHIIQDVLVKTKKLLRDLQDIIPDTYAS